MRYLTNFLCSILLLAMLVCQLGGCATEDNTKPSDTPTPTETEPTATAAPTEEESEKTDYLLTLPAENYGGEEINILCRTDKEYEIWIENLDGVVVDEAVYNRNSRVEERYGVHIYSVPVNGTWDTQSEFVSALSASTSTSDDAYQIVAGYLAYTATLASAGHFLDLNAIDTINTENPWWSQSFAQNGSLYNKLFICAGDLSLTMWEGLYAVTYNKKMAEDVAAIGNIYDMVRNHTWTLEQMAEISSMVYTDDGNDIVDANDTFGWLINRHSIRAFVTTSGIPLVNHSDDNELDLVYMTDRTIDLYDFLYDTIYNEDYVYYSKPSDDSDYSEMYQMFVKNRGLFMTCTLDICATLRSMEADFGIVPFPLYDTEQEEYLSHSYDGQSVFAIPTSASNPEMAGMILEAMSAENAYSVIPAFYDLVLMERTSRDAESREMLSIIRKNLFYDFGFINSLPIGNLFSFFGDIMQNKQTSIASSFEANYDTYIRNLEKLLDAYESME